jgi:hypothetical protein
VDRRTLIREPARRRRVQPGPLTWRQISLDRRPDDRVDEAQWPTLLEDRGACTALRQMAGANRARIPSRCLDRPLLAGLSGASFRGFRHAHLPGRRHLGACSATAKATVCKTGSPQEDPRQEGGRTTASLTACPRSHSSARPSAGSTRSPNGHTHRSPGNERYGQPSSKAGICARSAATCAPHRGQQSREVIALFATGQIQLTVVKSSPDTDRAGPARRSRVPGVLSQLPEWRAQTRKYAAELTSGTGHQRFDFTLGLLIGNLTQQATPR